MKTLSQLLLAAAMTAACFTGQVSATPVTYDYTGVDYFFPPSPYTSSMHVSGSFTVDAPLAPGFYDFVFGTPPPGLSYSFSDGIETYSSAFVAPSEFQIAVDPGGGIFFWFIGINTTLCKTPFTACALDIGPVDDLIGGTTPAGSITFESFRPGHWSGPLAAVEPGTLALLGLGFAALGFARRRR